MPGRIENPTASMSGLKIAADVVISKRKSIFAIVNDHHTIVYSSDTLAEVMEWVYDRDMTQVIIDCSGVEYLVNIQRLPDPRSAQHG